MKPREDNLNFRIAAKTRLLVLGVTVTQLAESLKLPRSTVSQSIHQNKFPRVRKLVAKHLKIAL
jgi:hypothetical protein